MHAHAPSPTAHTPLGLPQRWAFITPAVLVACLVILAHIHFIWFHSLAELFAVVVGISLFLMAYLSQRFTHSGFLLFLAQGFFWAACLDAVHLITYPGIGAALQDSGPQKTLWLGARLIQASALLAAPCFLHTRQLPGRFFIAWGGAACVFVVLAFSPLKMPLVFLNALGPVLVLGVLVMASAHFFRHRNEIDPLLHRFLQAVVGLTFLSELAFFAHTPALHGLEIAGHVLKFLAFWFLLSSIGVWMLARPFAFLSRSAFSFDAIPLPVLLVDSKGQIQSCNRVALSMRPNGGMGQHLHEAWHPEGLPLLQCPVCMGLHEGWEVHTELHDPKHQRWVSVHVKEVETDGEVKGFVYVQEDITSRRLAEERLAQTEKMEMVGQMTGGLAHDFNNLLGIVLGALDLLGPATTQDPKAARHRDLARQAALKASHISRSLLAVSRRQVLETRVLNISENLDQMAALIAQTAGPGVTVHTAITPHLWANTDPSGLSNALLNLVINARDAMPHGGAVSLALDAYRLEPDESTPPGSEGAGLLPGHYVRIRVSDTGQGIAPEVQSRLFEPFFTTKERGRGTGLGLAMVHGFVHQCGGAVHVDSEPGKGARFTLFLPAAPTPASPAHAAQAPDAHEGEYKDDEVGRDSPVPMTSCAASPPSTEDSDPKTLPHGQGERLLLVDDEQGLLEVASCWLIELGYRVRTIDNPEKARRLLARECFDVLLTDLLMPGGLGGIELAAQARFLCPEIRVLFVSGFSDEAHTQDVPLLQKPYTQHTLAWALHHVLSPSPTLAPPTIAIDALCTGRDRPENPP